MKEIRGERHEARRREPVTRLTEWRGQPPPFMQHDDPRPHAGIRRRQIARRRGFPGVECDHSSGHTNLLHAEKTTRVTRLSPGGTRVTISWWSPYISSGISSS